MWLLVRMSLIKEFCSKHSETKKWATTMWDPHIFMTFLLEPAPDINAFLDTTDTFVSMLQELGLKCRHTFKPHRVKKTIFSQSNAD